MRVTSGMTGPYGRLNHFGHPDASVRRYYIDWFKTFADITAELGGDSVGCSSPFYPARLSGSRPPRRADSYRH